MKRVVAALFVLLLAGSALADGIVPDGVTGLWRFQDSANKLTATVGVDLVTSHVGNSAWYSGPWTTIGYMGDPLYFSDGGVVQERSWDYLTVNPSFTANGGGSYVNEYTVAIDYVQTQSGWNSLFQTNWNGNTSDGDLWINGTTIGAATIGVGDAGYSTQTFDASTWHRIVWSIDNGSFFRAYVDGTLFLDGTPQGVDGRFSLYPDRFNLFADDSWEDMWGLVGTVATWGRALSTAEVAQMGGWIGGSATPTPLWVVPEPGTVVMLVLGALGLLAMRRR
jgi:hypothetical protein